MKIEYKTNGLPRYVYREISQHGSTRVRGRKDGRSYTFTYPVGSPQFEDEYALFLEGGSVSRPYDGRKRAKRRYIENMLASRLLAKCRNRAARKGISIDIDRDWLLDTFHDQAYRCSVSNMPFDLSEPKGARSPWRPSVDRIRSNEGYTKDNCRLVCTIVNLARLDWSDADFQMMCEAVYRRQNKP